MASCGAFCSYCGRCGRTIQEISRMNSVTRIAPPGVSQLDYSKSGENNEKSDLDCIGEERKPSHGERAKLR